MQLDNPHAFGNRIYGSPVTAVDRPATLQELVRQDALGRSREFSAKMVAFRLGADKFRVIDYLALLVKEGQITARVAVSPNKRSMEIFYGPRPGRESKPQ